MIMQSNLYKLDQLQKSCSVVDCGDFIKKVPTTLTDLKKTSYETPELYVQALMALKPDEVACMSINCPNPCMLDHYICIICIDGTEFQIYSKNSKKVIKPFNVSKQEFCYNYLETYKPATIEYQPNIDYTVQINNNLIVQNWFNITHINAGLEFTAKCLAEYFPSLITPEFYTKYELYDSTYTTNTKENETKVVSSNFIQDTIDLDSRYDEEDEDYTDDKAADTSDLDEWDQKVVQLYGDGWNKKGFQFQINEENTEKVNEACIFKWNFDIGSLDKFPPIMYTFTQLIAGKRIKNLRRKKSTRKRKKNVKCKTFKYW